MLIITVFPPSQVQTRPRGVLRIVQANSGEQVA